MCFVCVLLCDAVWCVFVFVFVVFVCVMCLNVSGLIAKYGVMVYGRLFVLVCVCVRAGFMCLCDLSLKACWCVLFVVCVCVCFMCLRVLCAMYGAMLYGLWFAMFLFLVSVLSIYVCDAFMMNGARLSGFVLCCCVFARVGFNVCVL